MPAITLCLHRRTRNDDQHRRTELYRRFQHIVATDLPHLTLMTHDSYSFAHRRVRNAWVTMDGLAGNLANVSLTEEYSA